MVESLKDCGAGRRLRVGSFLVEPGLNRVSSEQGAVQLEPRVMELLVCLARHAGETVAKEQLLAEVWGGSYVVDGVVAKTVSALRQALGDEAGQPRYILTVPRRGYRLIAAAVWDDDLPMEAVAALPAAVPAPKPAARRGWVAVALVIAVFLAVTAGWTFFREAARPGTARSAQADSSSLPIAQERLLLRARMLWSRRGGEELRQAHQLFQDVVVAAPESGEAHAWLALSLVTYSTYWQTAGRNTLLDAEVEVGRALALAPDHAVTQTALGVVAFNRHFDLDRSITSYRRALELDPEFAPAHQFLAESLCAKGRVEEARAEIRRAVELEPTSALMHGVEALVAMAANRPEEALAASERALALDTQFWWLHRYRAQAWLRLGDEAKAAQAFVLEWSGPTSTPASRELAELASHAGLDGLWRHRLGSLLKRRDQGGRVLHIHLAEAYAALGRREEALTELESGAVADEAEYFVHARPSPFFDTLRDHPRFRAAYARYGM